MNKSGEFDGCSFTILGAGRSGIAIAKFLNGRGFKVFLSDNNPEASLSYLNPGSLKEENISFETGGHSEKVFENDVIVKSPGINPVSPVMLKARELGIPVFGEVEIAYRFCICPVIAITGTNGKTTTTMLTGQIFQDAGLDARICGNVGKAFAEELDTITETSVIILEISSYQLEDTLKFKPAISVFMNFTEDHIEWHGNVQNYFNAKFKIVTNQDGDDLFIYNADENKIREKAKTLRIPKAAFSFENKQTELDGLKYSAFYKNGILFVKDGNFTFELIPRNDIKLIGDHNTQNFLAAGLVAYSYGIPIESIRKSMANFGGVEHRIEHCGTLNGIDFYNDSKATNFDSMLMCLNSFGKVVLISGGQNSTARIDVIFDTVIKKVEALICIGEMKEVLAEKFMRYLPVEIAETLDDAVRISFSHATAGIPVLFSPGFKSFDMFNDYEHRGSEFKKSVKKLINEND
ncbi:MAG: UDP-N-acetylmuramoyl-L-alanine--D-glutamate ligase [Ignavibacteriaceae bacterium]|nr:UDP-N-acetylmuramoyl-L-alanine--D-glutamate ligase [Ignavibacteriaceae bacterium]